MISQLRIATANPGYHPPTNSKAKSGKGGSYATADRTSALQKQMRASSANQQAMNGMCVTGDMPFHFGGRGYLEGTCMAKSEGLLESKREKRSRKRKRRKSIRKGDQYGSDSGSDDYYGSDSDSSDDDEEERRVWTSTSWRNNEEDEEEGQKNSSRITSAARKGCVIASNANQSSSSTPDGSNSLEAELNSLKIPTFDWSKTSKYGKESNKNFQHWIEEVAKKMHEQQVLSEDDLFIGL